MYVERAKVCRMDRIGIQTAVDALTKVQIEAVLDEWRSLGRDEFLRKHGVNRAAKYKIRIQDTDYDAKAILIVALRRFNSELHDVKPTDVESSEQSIAIPLRNLKFEIIAVDEDSLKLNDEAVAAEVRSLLQKDSSRMGEVWRLNQQGISHREIANQNCLCVV